MKMQFSGHNSFVCKNLWLKKGYDFLKANRSFADEMAVVYLGIGKNMIPSLHYWIRAYGITEDNTANQLTDIGRWLFDEQGYDPYIEDIGSIWLLHYLLIKTAKASLYTLFFNDFRKGRFQFTKETLANYLFRKTVSDQKPSISANTIRSDVSVFIRNYLQLSFKKKKVDVEEEFSNLMVDLQLMTVKTVENAVGDMIEWYELKSDVRYSLPYHIVLYTIIDNPQYGDSISFQELLYGFNSPGVVFALSEEALYKIIQEIKSNYYHSIVYSENAGIQELQFKKGKPERWIVLNDYYKIN